MRFGLFGGARTGRGAGPSDSHGYQDFIEYVVEAERLGFHGVFLVEHHFTGQGQVSASMTLLAYLAARTSRIRLGTAVVVLPWHNPVLVAEQAATLDLLSGGRLDLGVGKGYRRAEFAGFCTPIEEAQERFDEAIEVIRKAWTSEGRFSHRGRRWQFRDIVVEPEPLQRPHPPLWLAAGSEGSIRRAAREGYNLLLDQIASTDQIVERVALFREECARAGRAYDPAMVGVARGLQLIHSEAERAAAYETRARVVERIGDIAQGTRRDVPIEQDDAPLLGLPSEVVARLRRLEAGGVGYVLLVDPNASVAGLRAFAAEVMPAFAAGGAAAVR
ncbi:luciferase [Caldovatus sediminis]|uniref:Luciferase n=1 Tax=Caldovatus sediminis TaxID=2041189 RepID=A0A8J2Z809_9PROT|nr:LLM class flavin-dependent oxidoreductase [Caldovatus sediminis]GGG19231.1 luciferase [Caldovatus sediminis]